MLSEMQLATVLPTLNRVSVHGYWCRAIGYHLLQGPPPGSPPGSPPKPLWPRGAPTNGARYTPRGTFDSVYLASDAVTALQEVTAVFSHPSVPSFTLATHPWVLLTIDGIVEDVIDVCDQSIYPRLSTTMQELTGNWVYQQETYLQGNGPLPSTQVLGKAAYDSGCIKGIMYPSAKNLGQGTALVIFTDRLGASGNYLQVHDPHGNIKDRIP